MSLTLHSISCPVTKTMLDFALHYWVMTSVLKIISLQPFGQREKRVKSYTLR